MTRLNARSLGKKFAQHHPAKSRLETHFYLLLRGWHIEDDFVREFKPLLDRGFRLDYAVPNMKLGIELSGGLYMKTKSGHTSLKGVLRDNEKKNLLTLAGWKVLTYSTMEEMREFKEHYETLKNSSEKA